MIRYLLFLVFTISTFVCLQGQRMSEEEIGLEALYIQANQKKLLGKYDEAVELYSKLLEKSPLNAPAHYDLARVHQQLEEVDKAIDHCKKAVKYDPSNKWYRLTLATIYESAMEYREAAKQYAYLAPKEDDQDLYDRWANAHIEAGDEEKAIEVYNQADLKWGPNEGRSDVKADLYLGLGKKKEAIKEVEQWIAVYPRESEYVIKLSQFYVFIKEEKKAKKLLEKLRKTNPNNEDALAMLQALKSDSGESTGSELELLVNNESISIDAKIKALMPMVVKGSKGDVAQLLTLTSKISEDYSEAAPAQAIHADVLFLNGDYESAITYYDKTIAINKKVYEVWDQLMRCLQLTENVDRLSEVSASALDYYPNQAGPYYYQAMVAYAKSNIPDAKSWLEEAELISGGQGIVAEESMILQSRIINDQGDTEGAISNLISAALTLSSSQEYLGDLYNSSGDKAKAERAYNQAIKLGGDQQRIKLKIDAI